MATPKSTLSKFILSLPSALTGAQVVERAKARGMKTSRANVSRVRNLFRSSAKASAPVTQSSPKTEAARPAAPTATSRSKAEFVRSFPTTTSPKEIVRKAKAVGVKLGTAYVYNVWTRDKVGAQKKKSAAKPPTSKSTSAANGARPSASSSPSAEGLLKAVAAEVGLGRAIELLQRERDRVQSILKG
jgi:hypothetical protein